MNWLSHKASGTASDPTQQLLRNRRFNPSLGSASQASSVAGKGPELPRPVSSEKVRNRQEESSGRVEVWVARKRTVNPRPSTGHVVEKLGR